MYTLRIEQDENAQDPRSLDYTDCNLGAMICFHSRYNLGDEHDYDKDDYSGWDELRKQLIKDYRNDIILSLYLYDHSGITINTTGFSCRWDSGQVGFIILDRAQLLKTHGTKRITKAFKEKLFDYLKAEVETYDQYLTGDVYGYIVEDEDENEVDSCWGYYGYEYAKEEGEAVLKYYNEPKEQTPQTA